MNLQNPMMSRMTDLIGNSKISQFSQLLTAAKSPQNLVMTLMSQNPQMKALIDAAGGDPQKAFYSASQKAGKDPEAVIRQLRGMMKN
jgi:hypothetical protein